MRDVMEFLAALKSEQDKADEGQPQAASSDAASGGTDVDLAGVPEWIQAAMAEDAAPLPDFMFGLVDPDAAESFEIQDDPKPSRSKHVSGGRAQEEFSEDASEGSSRRSAHGSSRRSSKRGARYSSYGSRGQKPEEREPDPDPEGTARSILLRQLTMGPRTRKQLQDKLDAREIPAEIAQMLLDRYQELKLIDDAEFARMWVRSRSEYKNLGASALRRELVLKGVEASLIEQALEQVDEDQHRDSAQSLVARKVRNLNPELLSDRKERDKVVRRLVGMLVRKGHSPGTAFGVVNEALEDLR